MFFSNNLENFPYKVLVLLECSTQETILLPTICFNTVFSYCSFDSRIFVSAICFFLFNTFSFQICLLKRKAFSVNVQPIPGEWGLIIHPKEPTHWWNDSENWWGKGNTIRGPSIPILFFENTLINNDKERQPWLQHLCSQGSTSTAAKTDGEQLHL